MFDCNQHFHLCTTMPNLTKVCPECGTSVNVKKSACSCGHSFVLKRKVSHNTTRKSKRIAMRALESLSKTIATREQDRAYTAKKRSLETPDETMARLEQVTEYTLPERDH